MIIPGVKRANTKKNTKYSNTSYGEVPERPNMWHIFEKGMFKGIKNDNPMNFQINGEFCKIDISDTTSSRKLINNNWRSLRLKET